MQVRSPEAVGEWSQEVEAFKTAPGRVNINCKVLLTHHCLTSLLDLIVLNIEMYGEFYYATTHLVVASVSLFYNFFLGDC